MADHAPQRLDLRDYAEWVRRYDTLTPQDLNAIKERVAALKATPVVSIAMPTYNANRAWLDEAIQSVKAQVYPHWELCIADDASTDEAIKAHLREMAEADPRIKLVLRETNGHISAATNSALELATGDWVAFLDHDDILPPPTRWPTW
ncbi:MAG: glycosyltransferase [Burkholderiaceae bacterium]